MARFVACEHAERRCAIGKDGGKGFDRDLRDFVDGDRNDIRGEALAVARKRVDQRVAMFRVVQEQDRLFAARFAID